VKQASLSSSAMVMSRNQQKNMELNSCQTPVAFAQSCKQHLDHQPAFETKLMQKCRKINRQVGRFIRSVFWHKPRSNRNV